MISKNSLRSLVSRALGACVRRPDRRRQRALQAEQLESRIVLSAILLDFPGTNGDATVAGARATDMELESFQWGFSRTSLNGPITFNDLTFHRTIDSASNDLYVQSALQTLSTTPARLRLVDGGSNDLRLDLSNARLTNFSTANDGTESGALSFSNLAFTESLTTTQRTASWNLLNGAASSSAIAGPGNIDPASNSLNIQTVMEIGGQKILIDGFSWTANLDVDMSLANPLSGLAVGSNFKITRGVDSATAGILGSAAAGSTFSEIRITDRDLIVGQNRVTMEWKLSNAFFAGFDLAANTTDAPINTLELSYGQIELKVHQFNTTTGGLTNTETTTWDKAGNIVTATTDFGIANPLLVDNPNNPALNPVISSLNFGIPAGSTTALGKLAYEEIDWSVEKGVTLGLDVNPQPTFTPTSLGAMMVTLRAGQNSPAPALLGQLAKRSVISSVNAFEKNTTAPTSPLDAFTLNNVVVTSFSVESKGLDIPKIQFGLDFRSFSEAFTDRTVPATPMVTATNFNVQTQASTGALSFGGRTIDTLFELVITEAGVTSEVPVRSAGWSVSREASRTGENIEVGAPTQSAFNVNVLRGVHSPGLLAAAVRGTEIDSVSVRRFEVVDVNGRPTRRELYRWNLTDVFITGADMDMLPGNSLDEVDRISFLPKVVKLETPRTPTPDNPSTSFSSLWNFASQKGSGGADSLNDVNINDPVLQFGVDGLVASDKGMAIDSYQWGASLPVGETTRSGNRPPGNPDAGSLLLKTSRMPSPTLLAAALDGKGKSHKLTLPRGPAALSQSPYELALTKAYVNGYSYVDEIGLDKPETGVSVFVDESAQLDFTPLNADGTEGTKRSVNWNLVNDTTTLFNGFGGFQFPVDQRPEITVELFGSQLAADGYTFGIDNDINQLVGKSTAVVPLATRGNPAARTFNISTTLDATTPGLLNAIATKTLIPEIKITERRTVIGTSGAQFLPYREWLLTNVYIEKLDDKATAGEPYGVLNLELNAASARATYITYNAAFTPTSTNKRLNFADPPAIAPLAVAAIATDSDRVVDLPSRYTDPQLNYALTVVSGANLFDGVALNAQNRLVLNFKPGQAGNAQIRINGTNAFGLVSTLLVNVAVDDGISQAPAGTNTTTASNEDTTYIIKPADFGFTDPNDFPVDVLTAVRIASLPAKGSLTLNNVAVTVNQTIPVASMNSNQLRYTPLTNENGNNYASFTFQVQDNGGTANGGADLDPTPNTLTFNVLPVNDAPTLNASITMPAIAEDTTNPAGVFVSSLLAGMSDVDAGAVKGMAVRAVGNTGGAWQYSLNNGTDWIAFGSSQTAATARLLPADANTRVRFVPNANFSGSRSFNFYARDQTSGTAGSTVDLSLSSSKGGTTAFSTDIELGFATQVVTPVNDAPVIAAGSAFVTMPAITEDATNPDGVVLSTLSPLISDVDANALRGIAVIFANNTNGNWQYTVDGTTWQNFGTVSNSSARLLSLQTTRIRFVPKSNFNDPVGAAGAELHFVAWDRTTGSIGGTTEVPTLGERGGTTAFSESPGVYTQFVTPVNDAPTLNPADVFLTSINEDTSNSAGTLVSDLLTGMSDADADALKGMAVRATENNGGVWQYTLNNGTTWTAFGSPSDSAVRLLPANTDTRVRFVPNANVAGVRVLAFTAWDTTTGTAGGTANLTASTSTGGATAFSTDLGLAKQTIVPVNDAPTITAPNTAAPVFGSPLVFSTANSNAITIGDIDAASGVMQIAITVTNGGFNLSTLTGITITAGSNGSSRLTARGTLAELNAALNGSSFLPNAIGPALIQMLVDDLGNTGAGGPRTRNRAIEMSVALPAGTVELGALNAAAPTIRRSGNRDGSTATPDFYTFTIAAAADVRLNLSGLSADVDLRVFSAAGTLVGQSLFFSTTIENILMTALPAGTYLVDVRGQVVSAYDLTLSTATTSDDLITQAFNVDSPTAVTRPTVRQSSVSTSADLQDYFKFSTTAAGALRINLSGLSQDVDFELQDSVGRVIQAAGASGNTIENMLTSTLAVGTYHIRVFASGGLLTSNYDLTISTATTSDDLLTNSTSLGILGSQGSHRRTGSVAVGTDLQDYYAFAASGDVAISVSGLTNDVDVQVLDQFGRVLSSSTSGENNPESINLNIAAGSGSIFVRIFAFSGSSSYVFEARANSNAANADDLLSTATALPNPLTSLTRSGSVGGTGASGDPQDYYRFELSSARNISLTLSGLSADLDIELLDQFGQRIFFSQNSGSTNEAINISGLAIGVYFIRIFPFSPSSVSNYTLGLTV